MNKQYNQLSYKHSVMSFSSRSTCSFFNCRGNNNWRKYMPMHRHPIRAVEVDQSLQTSLHLELDPTLHAVKVQEKEQIKSLNNRFISLIDKVRHMEQQNMMLETEWKILQGEAHAESKLESMMKTYIATLQKQLHCLEKEKDHWDSELQNASLQVEEYRQRCEKEINLRTSAKKDFELVKQDVDISYLNHATLHASVADLEGELDFLKILYEEELHELEVNMQNTSVVVQIDNARELNMEHIVAEVKRQYEDVLACSCRDVEACYKKKLEVTSSKAESCKVVIMQYEYKISELKRHITRLQSDLSSAKMQCTSMDEQIAKAEKHGKKEEQMAQQKINTLQEKIQEAKQQMAEQVHTYQGLMNIKMALDIEIATYGTLLSEEEKRMDHEPDIFVQELQKLRQTMYKNPDCPKVYIKTTEIRDNVLSTNEDV